MSREEFVAGMKKIARSSAKDAVLWSGRWRWLSRCFGLFAVASFVVAMMQVPHGSYWSSAFQFGWSVYFGWSARKASRSGRAAFDDFMSHRQHTLEIIDRECRNQPE